MPASDSDSDPENETSSEEPIVSRVSSETKATSLNKPLSMYINSQFPVLIDKYNFYARLITCVYDPNEISKEKAWKKIHIDLKKIKDIIETDPNTLFITACIEIHTDSKNKKKKKTEDEKKSKTKIKPPKEDKEKKTLIGYPHIHLFVAYVSPDGNKLDESEIIREINDKTNFSSDVKIDGGKKGTETPDVVNFFRYVIKNSRHLQVYEANKEAIDVRKKTISKTNEQFKTYFNVFTFNTQKEESIYDFMEEILKKGALVHCYNSPKEKKTTANYSQLVKLKSNGSGSKDKETTRNEETQNIIFAKLCKFMEDNDLAIFASGVFKKIPDSRRSYSYYEDFEDIISELYADRDNQKYAFYVTDNKKRFSEIAYDKKQKFYPKININPYYVEFADCYFHIPSASVISGELPEDICCGFYADEVYYEQLREDDLALNFSPTYWLRPIMDQEFFKDDEKADLFLCKWYMLLLPLLNKSGVLTLIGKPGTGKSSTFEPLEKIIPKNQRLIIEKGEFGFQGLNENVRLVGLDDLEERVYRDNNQLKFLEGGRELVVNKKFQKSKTIRPSHNIYISANKIPEAFKDPKKAYAEEDSLAVNDKLIQYGLDEAFNVRLSIFEFNQKVNSKTRGKRDNTLDRLTNFEVAKILLFTSTFYAKVFLKREGEDGIGTIKFYKNYESAEKEIRDKEKIFEIETSYEKNTKGKRNPIEEESDEEIIRKQIRDFVGRKNTKK